MRVLIVEDHPKVGSVLRRGLRDRGLAPDLATSGEDALWMAAAPRYDAIVLDLLLPGIDGFETCRRLRADDVAAPILILTARGEGEDRVAGLDGGGGRFPLKPFLP